MYCEGTPGTDRHIIYSPEIMPKDCKGPRTSGVIVRGCKIVGEMPLAGEENAPLPPEGFRNAVGVGSEGSAGVQNVWFLGLEFEGRASGVCIKTNPERRGEYKKINIQG